MWCGGQGCVVWRARGFGVEGKEVVVWRARGFGVGGKRVWCGAEPHYLIMIKTTPP